MSLNRSETSLLHRWTGIYPRGLRTGRLLTLDVLKEETHGLRYHVTKGWDVRVSLVDPRVTDPRLGSVRIK